MNSFLRFITLISLVFSLSPAKQIYFSNITNNNGQSTALNLSPMGHSPNFELVGHTGGTITRSVLKDNFLFSIMGNYLAVFDVQNPAAPIIVSKSGPFEEQPTDISINGNKIYVANRSEGIHIFDISQPSSPKKIGGFIINSDALRVVTAKGLPYVFYSDGQLRVLDDSNPSNVTEIISIAIPAPYNITRLVVQGNYLFVAKGSELDIIDINYPINPQIITRFQISKNAYDLVIQGNYAYISSGQTGLLVLDISIPLDPKEISTLNGYFYQAIINQGRLISIGYNSSLRSFDLSDPKLPTLSCVYSSHYTGSLFASSGDNIFTEDGLSGSLRIFQYTLPSTIKEAGFYPSGGVLNIKVQGNYAYTIIENLGLQITDITDPANPKNRGSYVIDPMYEDPSTIWVDGSYAYLLSLETPYYSGSTITILDISNIDLPKKVGYIQMGNSSIGMLYNDLVKNGSFLYVRSFNETFILNVLNPTNPQQVGIISNCAGPMEVSGNKLYIGCFDLKIFDITNPTSPLLIGSVGSNNHVDDGLILDGNTAYLAGDGGLETIDISNPSLPVILWRPSGNTIGVNIVKSNSFVFMIDENSGGYSLEMINATNPNKPTLNSYFETSWDMYASIAVAGDYLLVGGRFVGLDILKVNGSQAPSNISGKVVDNQGIPLSNVKIYFQNLDSGLFNGTSTIQSDVNGNFTFSNIYGVNDIIPSDISYIFTPNLVHVAVPPDDIGIIIVGVKATVDIDVSNAKIRLSPYQEQLKEDQPNSTYIETTVKNLGSVNADNVNVVLYDFYSGTWVATTTVSSVPAGGEQIAKFKWTSNSSSSIEVGVYAQSNSSRPDINLSNNYSQTSTKLVTSFVPFRFNPDTFNFPNWKLGFSDFGGMMGDFFLNGPDSTLPDDVLLYSLTPLLYTFGSLSAGGHCYGLAQASTVYYENSTSKPANLDTYQMTKDTPGVLSSIRDNYMRQLFSVIPTRIGVELHMATMPPNTAYENIKQNILGNNPRPSILSLGWKDMKGGHVVVAYKTVEIGNDKSIFVYDNNDPLGGSSQGDILNLNLQSNSLQYRLMKPGTNEEVNLNFDLAVAIDPQLSLKNDIAKQVYQLLMQWIKQQNKTFVSFSWSQFASGPTPSSLTNGTYPNFYITDGQGRQTGYINGNLVSDIPNTALQLVDDVGYVLQMPSGQDFRLTVGGESSKQYNLSLVGQVSSDSMKDTIFQSFEFPSGEDAQVVIGPELADLMIKMDTGEVISPTNEYISKVTSSTIFLPSIQKK